MARARHPRATAASERKRNPYVRPRSRPPQGALPEVVDHRGSACPHCGRGHYVTFALRRGEDLAEDNIAAWTIWYRAEYEDGHVDHVCRYQRVIAAAESRAILTLRRLMYGFALRLHLFHVDGPPRKGDSGGRQ